MTANKYLMLRMEEELTSTGRGGGGAIITQAAPPHLTEQKVHR